MYDAEGRVVRTVTASVWTDEDRALMLGYDAYLASLCPGGCGHPRSKAHHWDNDGWYEAESIECHACTARENAGSKAEDFKPYELVSVIDTRDYEAKPLPQNA